MKVNIRYTEFPMPDYAFLPGVNLHPNKRQVNHLPEIPAKNKIINAENWQNLPAYLYATDLFNAGYYWEVHEILEPLWINAGKHSEEAVFLKGIIQIAVALLKVKTGNLYGAKLLLNKATNHLQKYAQIYFGIDIQKLLLDTNGLISGRNEKIPVIKLDGYVIKPQTNS